MSTNLFRDTVCLEVYLSGELHVSCLPLSDRTWSTSRVDRTCANCVRDRPSWHAVQFELLMGRQFTQGDVERAVRGALKAGMSVGRAEIDIVTGRIILTAGTEIPEQVDPLRDELAAWRASHGNC